ncbi:MAG: flippase-like domain-containing protein [Bacteroidales bacterium]|nr:flippase-like domain-containing protein [Bacteroidales bacterium]
MSPLRKRILLAFKAIVAAVLIVAVAWHFERLLRHPDVWKHIQSARFAYLIPAGFLYLVTHTIWGSFWVSLLRNQGAHVPWFVGLRAYFVSQFGKYVPGKAWVLVLRVGLLRHHGLSATIIAVTATYETLTSMSAGALIGVCLLSFAGERIGLTLASPQGVALLGIAFLPIALGVATRFIRRLPNPPVRLLLRGLLQDSLGWCCLGLSLWFTLRAIVHDEIHLTPVEFAEDLAAVALSYVAGFVVLVSPGGLGAREFVLQQVLIPQLAPFTGTAAAGVAAVTAVALRLVWTAFEVLCALILLVVGRSEPSPDPYANPREAQAMTTEKGSGHDA